MYKHFRSLLLLAVFPAAILVARPVSLPSPDIQVEITSENAWVYIDESASLTELDAAELPDSAWDSSPDSLIFGYGDSVIWLKISLSEPPTRPSALIDLYGVDRFDAWIVPSGNGVSRYQGRSGWVPSQGPESEHSPDGRSAVFLEGWVQQDSYLLIRTVSHTSRHLRYRIVGHERFESISYRFMVMQGVGLGVMALMIIIVLSIIQYSRNARHISLLILVMLNSVLIMYLIGFGPLTLWKGLPGLTDLINRTIYLLLGMTNLWFYSTFFDTSRYGYLKLFVRIPILVLGATLAAGFLLSGSTAYLLNLIVLTLFYFFVTGLLIHTIRIKVPISRILAVGWFLVLLTGILTNLMFAGVIVPPRQLLNIASPLVIALGIQSSVFVVAILVKAETSLVSERGSRVLAEKELEESRRLLSDTNRMEGLAKSVSVFSHELGNPIGNVRLLSTELKNRIDETLRHIESPGNIPEELVEYLEFSKDTYSLIDSTLLRAWEMVNSFKTVASDEARVTVREVRIDVYLNHLYQILQPSVRKKGHRLSLNLQASGTLKTIPGYLAQIITNLVNNAVTHGFTDGSSGNIRISSRRITEHELEISVSDDGAGIPVEVQPKIFQDFYTSATDSGGTGLGLGISWHLASNYLGGTLEYGLEENRGALFRLRLQDLCNPPIIDGHHS